MRIEIDLSDRAYRMLDRIETLLDRMIRYVESSDVAMYKVNLITYKTYTLESLENITKEMTDWLTAHGKKPEDIKWGACEIDSHMRFVGQLKDVAMSGTELAALTTKDNFIINICGHPWYMASRPEEVHDAGRN